MFAAGICLGNQIWLPALLGLGLAAIGGLPPWFLLVQAVLLVSRIGVLAGVNGSYARWAASFWLSLLLDVPVALRLLAAQFQRRLVWRGRVYVRSRNGTIMAVSD